MDPSVVNDPLPARPYQDQLREWPAAGRHILAHYDDNTIIVYQAFRPAIATHAIEHGKFGAEFSYSRMSWIKPNFLWMMYRSGWGTKEGQEVTLALRLSRTFFDGLLRAAVPSSFDAAVFADRTAWAIAVENSDVRLQWDPDHDPVGAPQQRRAIQLGLRGATLEAFGKRDLLQVIDMSTFVAGQRQALARGDTALHVPSERVYRPADVETARWIGLNET